MTNLSANASVEALADAQAEMKKLNLATDRSAVSTITVGVLL
jgi:ATP-binding cassette subfamily F protein 2